MASPLAFLSSYLTPSSKNAKQTLGSVLVGEELNAVEDVWKINTLLRARTANAMLPYLALSALDMALWDLLGSMCVPVGATYIYI